MQEVAGKVVGRGGQGELVRGDGLGEIGKKLVAGGAGLEMDPNAISGDQQAGQAACRW